MIFFFQGDIHGNVGDIQWLKYKTENTALILLGDAGFNFFGDKRDSLLKRQTELIKHYIYCVRGNHDIRPEDIKDIKTEYDENVCGNVMFENAYPHIRYFIDGDTYSLNELSTLVIGGAYSIDKDYRLKNHRTWIWNEQLTKEEMQKCLESVKGKSFDLVLTHTCPLSFQPTWLFLAACDQSTVDSSMEEWMEYQLKPAIDYKYWLFGHFHDSCAIGKGILLLYNHHISLSRLQHIDWSDERSIPSTFDIAPHYTFDKK